MIISSMDDQRKENLTAYVSLVGKVNRSLHSRAWWATDFSSKNRFNSHLPQLIENLPNKPTVSPITIIRKYFKRFASGGYHLFRLLFRYFYARRILAKKMAPVFSDQQPVYVIKTFIYDHSFTKDGQYKDAFFGQLPEFLKNKEQRIVFFANILGDYKFCLQKILQCPNAVIIPIDYCGCVSSILESVFVSWFYFPQVKGEYQFLNYEVSDLINAELASFSGTIQPYQYLHYAQTRNLLKKIPAKTFLLTYENNPWEKMCMLAVRESSPQTEIIGYQHTVTPQASVNMFISANEEAIIPKPDRVLTVGEVTKEIIERYTQISSLSIVASCALRYENLLKRASLERTKYFRILVALEGIGDVYKMVNYVLQELEGCKKYKIILRAHPVLPVSAFADKLFKKLNDLPFVEISQDHSLIEDIKRTDLTIYWGSTVALESLWLGKPVIHFDMQKLFSYDPLFDCSDLKWTINAHQKLTEVLDEIYSLSDQEFLCARQKAHDYLVRYFYPVNSSNLAHFVS